MCYFHYLKSILYHDLFKEYINPVVCINSKYIPQQKKVHCFNWLPLKYILKQKQLIVFISCHEHLREAVTGKY